MPPEQIVSYIYIRLIKTGRLFCPPPETYEVVKERLTGQDLIRSSRSLAHPMGIVPAERVRVVPQGKGRPFLFRRVLGFR